jgi:predicted NAD-dependent protein-ADP-ribosyltransferase YbiA (DUF1768 family)
MNDKTPILYNDPKYQPEKINGLYEYVVQNNERICGFFGEVGFFLSNGKKCSIRDPQDPLIIYPYSENAYQASKFEDIEIRKQFVNIDFKTAIKLAYYHRALIQKKWEDIKLTEMNRVLRQKFRDPKLQAKLIETGSKYLEETNHWKDVFWGVCYGVGENKLGKILMNIRDEVS